MRFTEATVIRGFRATTLATCGLLIGVALSERRNKLRLSQVPNGSTRSGSRDALKQLSQGWSEQLTPRSVYSSRRLAVSLTLVGGICFVASALLPTITTLSPLIAAGRNCLLTAICIAFWDAIRSKRRSAMYAWLAVTFALPVIWLLAFGFLSYAAIAFLVIFSFWISQSRWVAANPRKSFLAFAFVVYCGLSAFIVYMENRDALRQAVWGGRSLNARTAVVAEALSDATPFNPANERHLHLVNTRLNHNILYGMASDFLDRDPSQYAYGESLIWALSGFIPRALWPDKPAIGATDFFVQYTGAKVSKGTTVSAGLIFEMLINFGLLGVLFGFVLYGFILHRADQWCAAQLLKGDTASFARAHLVATPLIDSTTILVGLVAGVVTAYVIGTAIVLFSKAGGDVRRSPSTSAQFFTG